MKNKCRQKLKSKTLIIIKIKSFKIEKVFFFVTCKLEKPMLLYDTF